MRFRNIFTLAQLTHALFYGILVVLTDEKLCFLFKLWPQTGNHI